MNDPANRTPPTIMSILRRIGDSLRIDPLFLATARVHRTESRNPTRRCVIFILGMAPAYKDLYCSAIGSPIQSIAAPLLAIAIRRLTSVRWHTDGARIGGYSVSTCFGCIPQLHRGDRAEFGNAPC